MAENCHACKEPLDGALVRLEFSGFQSLALNGVTFTAHARCVRLVIPDRGVELPPRISDPAAEYEVSVKWSDNGWVADCRDHGNVAMKVERDDAELAAARHLGRVHLAEALA